MRVARAPDTLHPCRCTMPVQNQICRLLIGCRVRTFRYLSLASHRQSLGLHGFTTEQLAGMVAAHVENKHGVVDMANVCSHSISHALWSMRCCHSLSAPLVHSTNPAPFFFPAFSPFPPHHTTLPSSTALILPFQPPLHQLVQPRPLPVSAPVQLGQQCGQRIEVHVAGCCGG